MFSKTERYQIPTMTIANGKTRLGLSRGGNGWPLNALSIRDLTAKLEATHQQIIQGPNNLKHGESSIKTPDPPPG
jgi:basic membrane lipoprotein Med (substrate-binding protein (PBP1-ABC) superfamily)